MPRSQSKEDILSSPYQSKEDLKEDAFYCSQESFNPYKDSAINLRP
jgi:hypothetical protein